MADQETGVCNHWVLVYHLETKIIAKASKNENETTGCNDSYGLECFDTEEDMDVFIFAHGLIYPIGE